MEEPNGGFDGWGIIDAESARSGSSVPPPPPPRPLSDADVAATWSPYGGGPYLPSSTGTGTVMPRRRSSAGVVATVVSLVLVLLIGVVVVRSVGTTADPNTVPNGPTRVGPTATRNDQAVAEQALAGLSVMPAGWQPCCPAHVLGPSELREHICGVNAGLPAFTAGLGQQMSLDLTDAGVESGHLVATADVARSVSWARREFAYVDKPEYLTCTRKRAEEEAVATSPTEPSTISTVTARVPFNIGFPAVLDRSVTKFEDKFVGPGVVYTAVIRMRVDRVLVRLSVTTYDKPVEQATLNNVAGRISALAMLAAVR